MIAADWLFQIIGMAGVLCILASYFALQTGKLRADAMAYSAANFIGAALVAVSLFWHWNLAAFLLEAAWMLISMYGIVKCLKNHRGSRMRI